VLEDVSLRGACGGGELLAALRPAAGTLRALNTILLTDHVRLLMLLPWVFGGARGRDSQGAGHHQHGG
jgi:hypothetical protein